MADKFKATWVSHSSISDFLACPRAYYLNNMYKDPVSGNKITIMAPPLALGQAVHEVVESLSVMPTSERFNTSLWEKFRLAWDKVSGEKGGFSDEEQENKYKREGEEMLRRVEENPGPLKRLAVKIQMDLPHFWLSEKEEIILCGKIDWLEYLPDTDTVKILDFKTGKNEESEESLQLPIYYLLAKNCQSRKVTGIAYWYLRQDKGYKEQDLPDYEIAKEKILKIAQRVRLARKLNKLNCKDNGCRHCEPYEMIVKGQAKKVGVNEFRNDVYIIPKKSGVESVIL